ncbi:MAG TPA: DUF2268 domain-containing putative Zn-dependent protease, partial [Phototrophicaceae bacterium]|nr:DUF2268 domain-containing putative Zn-dependent protease [Phototrophicaceae bacterium]
MAPEQFAGDQRAWMQQTVAGLAAANAWKQAAVALEEGYAAFAPLHDRINLEAIVFALVIADISETSGQRGYSGFGAIPGYIMTVYGAANDYTLSRVKAATVHELHHNLAAAAGIGMGGNTNIMTTTVGEYMIGEGLAESFAAELYGADKVGFYVTDFDPSRLAETKCIIHDGLDRSGFDVVRGYIFGDEIAAQYNLPAAGVPAYAGYALGYQIVQAYLKRTGKTVVEATLVPAREIIAESRFFEEL